MRKLLATLVLASVALLGCDEDQNKVAQAQECLNNVAETDTAGAAACENFLEGVFSESAYAIRCSINFAAGGITTTRIVNAFDASGGGSTSAEAALITGLAFDAGSEAAAEALAASAQENCNASGVEGLMYLANLSAIGTQIASLAGLTGSIGTNFDPDASAGAINTAVTNCTATSSCDKEAIGTAAITLAGTYCNGGNASEAVCADINSAISAGGGDATATANQLLTLLQ